MIKPDQKSGQITTLEDLLRLKRTEKPDAAFWHDFERGMRKKQLAAIVEPRPWWLGLALLKHRLGAFGLPLSATAAAMLAVVVLRVAPDAGFNSGASTSSPEPVALANRPLSPVSTKAEALRVAEGVEKPNLPVVSAPVNAVPDRAPVAIVAAIENLPAASR